jgi:hypothetical protein
MGMVRRILVGDQERVLMIRKGASSGFSIPANTGSGLLGSKS